MRLLLTLLASAAAFSPLAPHAAPRGAPRGVVSSEPKPDGDVCEVDEPVVECAMRRNIDGPWADVWARYVLLRPGMSYRELKAATLQRNKLSQEERIPGTYRTVVLSHAACFLAAIPAIISSDQVFPRIVELAAASRAGVL